MGLLPEHLDWEERGASRCPGASRRTSRLRSGVNTVPL
jgi:hypothetical protein